MRSYDISYYDEETGDNFNYYTEVEDPTISGDLNAMVAVLRAAGYGDSLIEKMIGTTYFDKGQFENLDVSMEEILNEYQASKMNEGWDDPNDQN